MKLPCELCSDDPLTIVDCHKFYMMPRAQYNDHTMTIGSSEVGAKQVGTKTWLLALIIVF